MILSKLAISALGAFVVLGSTYLVIPGVSCDAQCGGVAGPNSETGKDEINLTVEVSDKSGNPISGLEASDFKLFDNKQPQQILAFQAFDAAHPPSTSPRVQIIVDAVNSGAAVVARERDGVNTFLKQNDGRVPFATSIWLLGNTGLVRIAGPSQDGAALLEGLNGTGALQRVITHSSGFWGEVERTGQAMKIMKGVLSNDSNTPGRKLILFLSPGWPLLTNYEVDDRHWIFDDITHFSNGLRESCMSVFTLDPSSFGTTNSFEYERFLKSVTKVRDAQNPNLALQVLSEHSGGQVILGGNDIAAEIGKALRGADTYYVLSFERASASRATEYHDLRVFVDKEHAKIHTTAGYYLVGP